MWRSRLLLADEPNVIRLVVCHGESRHAGASSKQASETQRRHTSARSRNERARGVLFASKPTRRCGSSAEAAMAAIKRPRETRNGRFWMLIELKKSCIGESDAGNQTGHTATKPRNARSGVDTVLDGARGGDFLCVEDSDGVEASEQGVGPAPLGCWF